MRTPRAFPVTTLTLCLAFLTGCSRQPTLSTSSPEARRLYEVGATQYERFYYAEAKATLEEALKHDSLFAMAWARLAAVNMNNQNEADEREEIGRAMSLMGNATRREQMVIRMLDRRFHYDNVAAARIADSLIEEYPDEKEAYVIRGLIDQFNNNYEAALKSYERAVKVDTGYALAYMYIGYAYSNLGRQDEALANMEHYIRLAPDAADPHASYADLLMRVGRYDEALEQHRKALALKPDYWYSFMQIGNIAAAKGKLNEAEAEFHRSLKLRPSNRTIEAAHLSVAAVLNVYRGKYKEAVDMEVSALALDSVNGEAANGLVYALAKLRRFTDAWNVVRRIHLELENRNMIGTAAMLGYYLTVGNLLKEEGRTDEAAAACDSALEFSDPLTRGPVYRLLAEIRLAQKQYDDALDACEEALRVNPNAPMSLLTLVKIYHAMGDRDMTAEIGNRLLRFWSGADPDYEPLHELKALLGAGTPRGSSDV